MPVINPLSAAGDTPAGDILNTVKARFGMVPNIFATMAHSPALLQGYLGYSDALNQGVLSAAVREQIALAVAGENECDYCASAHTAMARGAGVSAEEATRNLRGEAADGRVAAILTFVRSVVKNRGHIDAAAVAVLRAQDVSDAELVEIIAHIGVNLFTNYFNHVVGTDIDFPRVAAAQQQRAA